MGLIYLIIIIFATAVIKQIRRHSKTVGRNNSKKLRKQLALQVEIVSNFTADLAL